MSQKINTKYIQNEKNKTLKLSPNAKFNNNIHMNEKKECKCHNQND